MNWGVEPLVRALRTLVVRVAGGAELPPRRRLSLKAGGNVTVAAVDRPAADEAEVTISSSGGLSPPLGSVWGEELLVDTNDYTDRSTTTYHFTTSQPSGNINLTGLAGGVVGRFLFVAYDTAGRTLTLKHDSASSLATNRVECPGSADIVMGPDNIYGVLLVYTTFNRWYVVAMTPRRVAGLSVPGRTGSTIGQPVDITASADNQVLRRSSGALGFGTIDAASVGSGTLGVARGGTGAATLTAHGVLIGEGVAAVSATGAGTAGQVLISNGASADPAFADPITATKGEYVSAGLYTITTANGTWGSVNDGVQDVKVTLPSAGTYLVFAYGRVVAQSTANGNISFMLRNTTDGTDIANSETLGILQGATTRTDVTALVVAIITVTGSKDITLRVKRDTATTWTISQVASDGNGRTKIGYFKIGP